MANNTYIQPKHNNNEKIPVERFFVDRNNARELFNVTYKFLKENDCNSVIYYWGVGGMGKSSLLDELGKSIQDKSIYVKYNLEFSCDEIQILFYLRQKLANSNKEFLFPRFDAALSAYLKKVGKEYVTNIKGEEDSVSQSILNLAFDYIGKFSPIVNLANSLGRKTFNTIVDIIDYLKEKDNNNSKDYIEINKQYKSESDDSTKNLLKYVKDFFIGDYNNSIARILHKKDTLLPIVIAIDTFELFGLNLKNTICEDSDWLINKEKGIVHCLNNTLFVICGRNQITDSNCFEVAKDNDKFYLSSYSSTSANQENFLELNKLDYASIGNACNGRNEPFFNLCYRLDGLDKEYVADILEKEGIHSPEIQDQIWITSNGMPLYVWLCVDIYTQKNGNVTVDDFKGEIKELTERFLRYIDEEEERDTIIKMSLIGQWSDEEMYQLMEIGEGSKDTSKIAKYKNLLKNSFIKKENNSRFIFHDVVRNCIYESSFNQDKEIKNRNIRALISIYERELECDKWSEYQLNRIIDLASRVLEEDEIIRVSECIKKIVDISTYKNYDKAIEVYQFLYNKQIEIFKKDNQSSLEILSIIASLYRLNVSIDYRKTIDIYKDLYSKTKKIYSEDDKKSIDVHFQLAYHYYCIGGNRLELAKAHFKYIYEQCKRLSHEYNTEMIKSGYYLAETHNRSKEYKKSLQILKEIYEKNTLKINDDIEKDNDIASALARAYSLNGEHDTAIEIYREIYTANRKKYGENNDDTWNSFTNLYLSIKNGNKNVIEFFKKIYQEKKNSSCLVDDIADSIFDLAWAYSKEKDHLESSKLFSQVCELRKQCQKADMLVPIADSLYFYSCELFEIDDYKSSIDGYIYALDLYNKKFDNTDSHVILTLRSIANTYSKNEDHENALIYYQREYETIKVLYDKYDEKMIGTQLRIAYEYYCLENYSQALAIYQDIYSIKDMFDSRSFYIKEAQDKITEILNKENKQ